MNYGIPYMGSKSTIIRKILNIFPKTENFYDLFGGGFSITHGMILHRSKDYSCFHFNEIRPGIIELIKDAISGKYSYEKFKPKFIDREEFLKLKDSNAYIKMCWSFGNNGRDYLFSKEIEDYKRSLHNAIIFNEFNDVAKKVLGINSFHPSSTIQQRRFFLRNRVAKNSKTKDQGALQQLQQLLRLEQLQRLQRLERLERLQFYNTSYEKVPIKKNSVIYCDIPYLGTAEYDGNKNFNHRQFYEWAVNQKEPVFISEYSMPEKKLRKIFSIKKRSNMKSSGSALIKNECIFVNDAAYELIKHKIYVKVR